MTRFLVIAVALLAVVAAPCAADDPVPPDPETVHHEVPDEPRATADELPPRMTKAAAVVERDGYVSVQVNVDADGNNIVRDAANEPSIAVDPTAPNRMAIGWRQFGTIRSNFRQAGWGFSRDGGRTWTFPGEIEPEVFRSDPVLGVDAEGGFYYYSLRSEGEQILCDLFLSADAGATWGPRIPAHGGDKQWFAIDRTGGIGHGNFYASWTTAGTPCCERRIFTRSVDGGHTFDEPIELELIPIWGTPAIGPEGELYMVGNIEYALEFFVVLRSDDARDPAVWPPTFEAVIIDMGGTQTTGNGTWPYTDPNPVGLLGQLWIDVDTSGGPYHGNVYVLASVEPDSPDPMNVHFIRSEDGGATWSDPVAIHPDDRNAWQWFGTMSVAPNGRIDVVWVESLDGATPEVGELYYTSSSDAGYSWDQAVPVSPSFSSYLGWPRQNKLGDYYHMVSDEVGADLAWAATFNNEQDVYYLRIGDRDCNRNAVGDSSDLTSGVSADCNHNEIPDECEIAAETVSDSDGNGVIDTCELIDRGPRRPGGRIGG